MEKDPLKGGRVNKIKLLKNKIKKSLSKKEKKNLKKKRKGKFRQRKNKSSSNKKTTTTREHLGSDGKEYEVPLFGKEYWVEGERYPYELMDDDGYWPYNHVPWGGFGRYYYDEYGGVEYSDGMKIDFSKEAWGKNGEYYQFPYRNNYDVGYLEIFKHGYYAGPLNHYGEPIYNNKENDGGYWAYYYDYDYEYEDYDYSWRWNKGPPRLPLYPNFDRDDKYGMQPLNWAEHRREEGLEPPPTNNYGYYIYRDTDVDDYYWVYDYNFGDDWTWEHIENFKKQFDNLKSKQITAISNAINKVPENNIIKQKSLTLLMEAFNKHEDVEDNNDDREKEIWF